MGGGVSLAEDATRNHLEISFRNWIPEVKESRAPIAAHILR